MRFDHPSVQKIAKAHGKDQAQIMLRWGLQHVSFSICARRLLCS
jgi:diketogulonate reductase-like aldo/keto reductase